MQDAGQARTEPGPRFSWPESLEILRKFNVSAREARRIFWGFGYLFGVEIIEIRGKINVSAREARRILWGFGYPFWDEY